MNKFASFNFEDADKINKHLDSYPLAGGTNVFASNGKLIVQYQDGQDETPASQIITLKEEIRIFRKSKDEIEHSNRVLQTLIADAKSRIEIAQAEVSRIEGEMDGASSNRAKKALKDELTFAEQTLVERKQTLHELTSQEFKNKHEMERLNLNIELFEERIAQLGQ